ncbi:hypothetical protein AtubIFM57258_004605 [Aspergillus tubingensis]|nr:hypothetical protein AtubIFM57258_004605 [Aspergillus tubingensis]
MALEPALPTSLESAPPAPLEPVIMSPPTQNGFPYFPQEGPSTQNGFLDYSEEGNPMVMTLSSRDEPSRLLMDNYIIDTFLPDSERNAQSVPREGYAGNISGWIPSVVLMDYAGLMFPTPGASMPSGVPVPGPPFDRPIWRGSLEVSEQKRNQLFTEMKEILITAGIGDIADFPTCLRLERFLETCFECFLDYLPFIHVPTWQAEAAHPCLLLAMLTVGAGSYEEYNITRAFYYGATYLIKTYPMYVYAEPTMMLFAK